MQTNSSTILVLGSDHELPRLLSGMLAADGCVVLGCRRAAHVQVRPGSQARPPLLTALIIDGPPSPDVLSLIANLRRSGTLIPKAPVLFLSEQAVDWADIAAIGAWLVIKPASMLDLAAHVRRAISRAPARLDPPCPGPATRRGQVRASARCLTRWWSTRATGVLCTDGWTDGRALLSQGGPVGEDGMAAMIHALLGGAISLERCEVDEPGDRAALGGLLWRAARQAVLGDSVDSLIPAANSLTPSSAALPLSPDTRRCLGQLGSRTIGQLARYDAGVGPRQDQCAQVVGADFATLRWLGLIELREHQDAGRELDADGPTFPGAIIEPGDPNTQPIVSSDASSVVLERIIRDGIDAVSRGDWVRADELLASAHRRAPDNAVVTAHLGWARFHSWDLSPQRRAAEAAELIELALQIDPDCTLAWRYCGELASCRGDQPEADRCFTQSRRA